MSKNAFRAYANASQTIAPTRQIVMLYDAAIRFLQQAKIAMEQGKALDRFTLLTKAGEIVFGLQSALDFEKGGDVAQTLYSFYSSVDARILSLHRNQNVALCDQVIGDLKRMRDSWAEIDASQHGAITATPEPAPAALPHNPEDGSAGLTLSA